MVATDTTRELTAQRRFGASVQRFRERGWWQDGSAATLLDRWATECPERRFVSDGTVELDYATTRARAYRLGARLLAEGVRPGDRVAVQLPNWAEFAVSYLAIARIGAVLVPIMTVYRHAEVAHVLHNSGAVAAVTTGEFRGFDHAGMFRALRAECPELRTLVIARSESQDGELAFDEACAGETVPDDAVPDDAVPDDAVPDDAVPDDAVPDDAVLDDAVPDDAVLGPHRDPDLPHLIVYTSGTESTAKGCVHTWNTLDFSGRGLAHDVFHMTPDDVMFMPSPVAHATGLVVGFLVPLAVGAQTHLIDVWEPHEGLRRIAEYRCTATATATPFVRMALDAARTDAPDVSSMRFWLCAGAPIPEALAREFGEVFTGGQLVPLYGASEVMAATCCHLGDSLERMSGSDGTPALDGIEIKILGPDGDPAAPGEEGEICYRGPGAILGYWREPERSAAVIDGDGWHHMGDLGRADAEGYVRVTGRLKDIIIRGGTNISAGEVEGHLMAHPAVAAVAVVAFPDDRLGEKAAAIVVAAEGAAPTLDELAAYLRDERRIAPHKLPEKLVLVDALPMTATGKVQKFRLRDLARGEA